MNNYLAKPVKPNTLKALLESYISKEKQPEVPNLQIEAKKIVKNVLSDVEKAAQDNKTKSENAEIVDGTTEQKKTSRPSSIKRTSTVQHISQPLTPTGQPGQGP
jgi:YesN/AraC family two-component response regulator